MGLFSRNGKVETNWRSKAWLISPKKIRLTILGRKAKKPMHVPPWTNQKPKPLTQKTANTTNSPKPSFLIDDTFDPSIFAESRSQVVNMRILIFVLTFQTSATYAHN
jgi:hypothetical protein